MDSPSEDLRESARLLSRRDALRAVAGTALGVAWGAPALGATADKPDLARLHVEAVRWRTTLANRILPYWYDTGIDWKRGGYALADDAVRGRSEPDEKQLVTQARMVWTFSLVHREGFSTPERDYLKAARHGVEFLRAAMRDREHGGYFWSVTPDGRLRDGRKRLYGEAFVVYALVEYHRASGDPAALKEALGLYRELQRRTHDAAHQGWMEHFERDWTPLPVGDRNAIVELAGHKSANTHLHWMEALAELYAESRDADVRRSLTEALGLNRRYFYPADPAKSAFHFRPDWSPSTDPSSAGLSYGHNVEFAWLMIRAEEVLRQGTRFSLHATPSWAHFHAHVDHALAHGTDLERGGTYNRGADNGPATDTSKVWWVQAEMIAALTDGLAHQPGNMAYQEALLRTFQFVDAHMTDARTGIWLDTVTREGAPKSTGLAHNWKANYHDVRALVKFVNAFHLRPRAMLKPVGR